jgi:RimJ/RimL family protein N-acetyltransferase
MKIVPSGRLHYRLMNLSDKDLLLEVDKDPVVMKYINNGIAASDQDIEDITLPRLAKYINPSKGWGIWEVRENQSKSYLGWILVRPMHYFSARPDFDNWELGWRFKQACWGKGYASESAKHIMLALSKAHNVTSFSAIADADNQASIKVMKKIGMTFEKSALYKDPLINMQVEYYRIDL